MRNKTSPGMIQTTCLISPHYNELRKKHGITLSEVIRVGMSMILAEKDIAEYDNQLNLHRKMILFKQMAEEANSKLDQLNKQ